MKKTFKRLTAMALALVMILGLAACGGSKPTADTAPAAQPAADNAPAAAPADAPAAAPADDGAPVYGGTLNSYYTEFYNEFDPSAHWNRAYISFYLDMLWNLKWDVDRNEFCFVNDYINSNYLTGQIAKDWEIAPDYTSMTVHLRDDVYFQNKSDIGIDEKYDVYDGRQLVADDVKWSYDRITGLDGAQLVALDMTNWTTSLSMLESVEVVDDFTVVFHFNTDNALAVENFMCVPVNIGGHEWGELTNEQQTDWHYAAGSGPFILTDFVSDNTMNFTKNPNYWDTDADGNPLPYLDEVNLLYITEKSNVVSSFVAGNLDAIVHASTVLEADQVATMKAGLKEDQYREYVYLRSPMCIGLKQGNNPVEALTNPKVREALQYAIDKEGISAFRGFDYSDANGPEDYIVGCFQAGSAWNDIHNWGDDVVASYTTYDPALCEKLLDEAGYPRGADGTRFSFDVVIFAMLPVECFQLVAEQLAAVGVTMNLTVGNTPPEMTSVGAASDEPGSVFFNVAASGMTQLDAAIRSDSFVNYVHQPEDAIDDLLDAVLAATTLEDQISAAKALDKEYMSQHWLLMFTYAEQVRNWYRSYVKGLSGEQPIAVYHAGYMYARTWKDAQ